jgi:hypothetical protein
MSIRAESHPLEQRPDYILREEDRRKERVAVGQICRCGKCICCEEAKLEWVNRRNLRS